MALSQPGPREPEQPSPHSRQQLQECPPSDPAEPRSPPQECPPSDPAEPRSPPQECPPSDPAEPRSPPQECSPPGPADRRSPPQELPPSGAAEPHSAPQEFPAEPRSPAEELPRSGHAELYSAPQDLPPEPRSLREELPPSGPGEPRSPPEDLPRSGPSEPRSPQQEFPAEPRSPPAELPRSGLAESRSLPEDLPPSGPAEPRSPPAELPPSGPSEPRSPQQEFPAEPRSPPAELPRSGPAESRSLPDDLPASGPAEPRSPPAELPRSGPAESCSLPEDLPPSGPAGSRSLPAELPPSGPAEPRSPQQELPSEPRSPPAELPRSGPAEPRSPPAELPRSGPAEPRPSALPGLGRQLRVLLTPLPVAAWPRAQKRLLSRRGPAGKRQCLEPESGPAAAPGPSSAARGPRAAPGPSSAARGPRAAPGPSSAARGQDGLWDADSDGSDGGDAVPDGHSQLSAYERKRLKNITENAKFFASLKLHESAARLNQLTTKRQSHVTKRVNDSRARPRKAEDEPARRRSMRLLRVEPLDLPLLESLARPAPEEYPQVPAGPLPMVPEDQTESSKWTETLLSTWMRISEVNTDHADWGTHDIKRYQESLSSMVLSEENVRKVVKARVCSLAIHPSQSTILVAAGDKLGHVGLWNVGCRAEEGVHTFIPHSFQVSCMHFSPSNPAHLLSLGSDTLRCADVTRAVFDEICRSEESFSCFDFLEENACSAIVSHWDGAVAVVDRRSPGLSPELSADLGFRRTRTVHVHPLNRHYFLAAGSVDVCVFDVRYLKAEGNKPLSSLPGHTKSVASAYFSPVTGSRVVTICADDKLRVYDTTSLSSTVTLLSSIRHNSNTGRWLSRFRAIWDPKQEHCFLVGSMAQPRQIQVFQDTGTLLHSHRGEFLTSVCSINVVHPSQSILVGGNSSGRLHVFK